MSLTHPTLRTTGAPEANRTGIRPFEIHVPQEQANVGPVEARVMHAVQQPSAWSAVEEVMGVPAWKSHPSRFLGAEGDQTVPPDAQRQFAARMNATTVVVSTNHLEYVLQLFETAAEPVRATN